MSETTTLPFKEITAIIYAKSAVDLVTKMGTYAYYFVAPGQGQHTESHAFKKSCPTLVFADCAALVNAIDFFAKLQIMEDASHVEVVTDSGVVYDLLTVYKSQKHCEDIAAYWRDKLEPLFKDKTLKVRKVTSKVLAGDFDSGYVVKCNIAAQGLLHRKQDALK